MRTTIDIDAPILADLKRLQKREGKSLGRLASDLLAQALATHKSAAAKPNSFRWITASGAPLIEYADREALYDALDLPQR